MKMMIASDIHGSAYWCEKMLRFFRASGADRLLLLGDLLYHGPRNDLPDVYAPKQVIEMLNSLREQIFCVRGNCEAEVDQMVLQFPIMAEYCLLPTGEHIIYAAHGHHSGEKNPPPLAKGDYLFCGHTHIPAFSRHETFTYVNPGSVSIPKDGTPHSCMLLDGDMLEWYDLADGACLRREMLK